MTNYEKRMNNAASDLNTILRECKTFREYDNIFNWEITENGTIEFYCNNEIVLQVYKTLVNKEYAIVFYNDNEIEKYFSETIELGTILINNHMFYSVVNFNKMHVAIDNSEYMKLQDRRVTAYNFEN